MHFRTFGAVALSIAAFTALAPPTSAQTISISGLSPGAQAIWNACSDVSSRMIRQQMALMHIGVDEELGKIRPGFEAFAGADKAKLLAGLDDLRRHPSTDAPELTAEFYTCLGNARLAQIDGGAARTPAPSQPGSSSPFGTGAHASNDMNGDWRGDSSKNEVTMIARNGGIDVSAVTHNAGQSQQMFFQATAADEYRFTFPDNTQAVIKIMQPGVLRITNPDGWTDVFRLFNRHQ